MLSRNATDIRYYVAIQDASLIITMEVADVHQADSSDIWTAPMPESVSLRFVGNHFVKSLRDFFINELLQILKLDVAGPPLLTFIIDSYL